MVRIDAERTPVTSRDFAEILKQLCAEVDRADKPANRVNYQQFFKEKLTEPVGLRSSVLREISNRLFRARFTARSPEVLPCCEFLLRSQARYRRFFAFDWALKAKPQYAPKEFARFARWLKQHVDSWGNCDHLCCGPLGELILKFPDLSVKMRPWQRSKNRWLRRGSAVGLIVPLRKGLLLAEAFAAARALLTDEDDLVQKGYGWMLKEASRAFPKEVFAFLMKHRERMPRTALRYAIEKYPAAKRKAAIARG